MELNQYEIYWINLDPTVGGEIRKTRPCVIISPNEINLYLKTILVAPVTSTINVIPFRQKILLNNKFSMVALDQIRAIDKSRISDYIGKLDIETIKQLKSKINEMLVK
ncbi:MAG: type II toxin-antitoxin system PemK/MazF family toxin [Ginsengibacter sp.]